MPFKLKNLFLNILFTVFVFILVTFLCILSYSYVKRNSDIAQPILLTSDFQNHKRIINENNDNELYYTIDNYNSDLYKKQPNLEIKNVVNHNNIPKDNLEIEDILQNIIHKNPLVKYVYVQIGIFVNKDVIDDLINVLFQKNLLNEGSTIYISEKNIEEKKVFVVEIGVFENNKDALRFCDNLAQISIGCIVLEE